ncbi:MAG: hypothetical protein ACTSSJ_01625 [Candidatus Odinarchaeia archaeon]
MSRFNENEFNHYKASKELNVEFKDTYTFEEQLLRVPDEKALEIKEKYNLPLQLAKAVYLITINNLIDERECVEFFDWLLNIYRINGYEVPDIPSYMLRIASLGFKWMYFAYRELPKKVDVCSRNLLNLEQAVKNLDNAPLERITQFLDVRENLSKELFLKSFKEWFDDTQITPSYLLQLIISVLEGTPLKESEGNILAVKEKLIAKIERLLTRLRNEKTSTKRKLEAIRNKLEKNVDNLPIDVLPHLLIEAIRIPEPYQAPMEHGKYMYIHSPITRGGMVEPNMESPIDFLERDIKLARRRCGIERINFLNKSIKHVHKALVKQGYDQLTATVKMIMGINERLDFKPIDADEIEKTIKRRILTMLSEKGKVETSALEEDISLSSSEFLKKYDVKPAWFYSIIRDYLKGNYF